MLAPMGIGAMRSESTIALTHFLGSSGSPAMNRLLFAAAVLISTVAASSAVANDYYVVTVHPITAKKGQRAVAMVSVQPKGMYHINTEYPVKLTIMAPASVTVEKANQTKDDAKAFNSRELDFEVAFVSNAYGASSFSGDLRFGVITDTDSRPSAEKVSFTFETK